MKAEIKRAHELRNVIVGEKKWELLFEPSDFFLKYNHYLACHIIGTGTTTNYNLLVMVIYLFYYYFYLYE